MFRFSRRTSLRFLLLSAVVIASSLVVFYHTLIGGQRKNGLPHREWSVDGDASPSGQAGFWPWISDRNDAVCSSVILSPRVDIKTVQVYQNLNFKPNYRSYWNLKLERNYQSRKEQWPQMPLRVIVLPHSHNDPGWLRTFDSYYVSLTAHILDNMADQLYRHADLSFVWAEIAFFAKWWDSLKNRPGVKKRVEEIVRRKQLEFGTGGWVMTDEATTHYYSIIDQMIEGHQWLKLTLNITPTNGWSIDPFGHSGTVPYLLRESGIDNMVIQRTHYAWKQYLAERNQLEFVWKQISASPLADLKNTGDVLCHMAPFDLYSIKHTCGPDTNICLQFDFRKIVGEYSESRASEIHEKNIRERAELLLGQYGRIGSLFPHNVALVPLGDDFRYNYDTEWDQQYTNYRKLFDYINSRKDWYARISFGTLRDYFEEVRKRTKKFATLSGDFFPYGDIYADGRPSYWTGYFTTRPYWKHLCRELEHWLRAAEILYTLSRAFVRQRGYPHLLQKLDADYKYLTYGRDNLGLFQHHDAITGTSKEAVMIDYGNRLFRSLQEVAGVVSHSTQYLLFRNLQQHALKRPLTTNLYPDFERTSFDFLPKKIPLHFSSSLGKRLILYNSLSQRRQEAVRVVVKTPGIKILDPSDNPIKIQINPIWNGTVDILSNRYQVCFVVDLPPLSLSTYTIVESKESQDDSYRSTVSVILNDATSRHLRHSVFKFHNPVDDDVILTSPFVSATFSKQTGLLSHLKLIEPRIYTKVVTSFQAYQSREYRSGAYLFQPDPQDPIKNVTGRFPIIRVVRGHLVSEVTAIYPGSLSLTGRVYHTRGPLGMGVELEATYDLSQQPFTEIEMFLKFQTNIETEHTFFTDGNGYQMLKRIYNFEIPLEGNYYPVTSAAYIEDSNMRLNLLVSHAHGSSLSENGALEIMLDRRMRYDDSRGLAEGVMDNKKTNEKFWLILESRADLISPEDVPNLSWLAHTLSNILLYPAILLVSDDSSSSIRKNMSFLEYPFSSDTHLVNFRTLPTQSDFSKPSNNSLLILHRKAVTCYIDNPTAKPLEKDGGIVSPFKEIQVYSVRKTTLTGTRVLETQPKIENISLDPMNIVSFNVTL